MNHKNIARVIAVAVSAALLSGCVIMKTNNSITPGGTVSSTMEMQVTPGVLSLAAASGAMSLPNVTVSSLTADSVAMSSNRCVLTNLEVTYAATGDLGTLLPTVGMNIAIIDLVTSNYLDSNNFYIVGDVASVEKSGDNVTLTLENDTQTIIRTSDIYEIDSGDCKPLGTLTSATLTAGEEFFLQQNWTLEDTYKAWGNTSKADLGYYLSLGGILQSIGYGTDFTYSPESVALVAYLQNHNSFGALLERHLAVGELPAIINTIPGFKTFRTGKIQGVKYTYKTNLTALKRNLTETPAPTATTLPNLPTWLPNGKQWNLYQRIYGEELVASDVTGLPLDELIYEATRTGEIHQSYKIAGIITHTNGKWKKKGNTVTWDIKNIASAKDFNAELSVVLGYPVAFPVKRSMSQASIIKQIKSNTKKIKAASAVSVVAIEDGRLTKASSIKLNHKIAKMRALAVKNALIKQGVKASKITISYVKSGAEKKSRISQASRSVVVGIS